MAALPVLERCLFCSWEWTGTSVQGREQALVHRLQAHPELIVQRRRPGRHLKSFRQPVLNRQDWKEVYAEREKRAKLLGIEIPAEVV